jgi:hypothetical protein
MFNPLNYLKFLYSYLRLSIEARLPNVPARRAISGPLAAAAIGTIIFVGGILIYVLVTSSGPSTTTYP